MRSFALLICTCLLQKNCCSYTPPDDALPISPDVSHGKKMQEVRKFIPGSVFDTKGAAKWRRYLRESLSSTLNKNFVQKWFTIIIPPPRGYT